MSKADLTRLAVLDTALRTASTVGLHGLTIGSLAEQAELSKSGLFAHFRSKQTLQLAVLDHAADQFVELVLRPALKAARGEPRVRELFERWLTWNREVLPGGCIFVAASTEFDDEQGPVRERLVAHQRDWLEALATIFRSGVTDGQFRADAEPEQFAQDFQGILLACHHAQRLLDDPRAGERARRAVDALLAAARRDCD
ncbi:TetR/AcrR family transcriptional regulator [Flindersiella endophytica]